MDNAQREMSLREWVDTFSPSHRVHRELASLEEQLTAYDWIPTSESVPSTDEWCWLVTGDHSMVPGHYNPVTGEWVDYMWTKIDNVLFYMPVPPLPEELTDGW